MGCEHEEAKTVDVTLLECTCLEFGIASFQWFSFWPVKQEKNCMKWKETVKHISTKWWKRSGCEQRLIDATCDNSKTRDFHFLCDAVIGTSGSSRINVAAAYWTGEASPIRRHLILFFCSLSYDVPFYNRGEQWSEKDEVKLHSVCACPLLSPRRRRGRRGRRSIDCKWAQWRTFPPSLSPSLFIFYGRVSFPSLASSSFLSWDPIHMSRNSAWKRG